MQMGWIRRAQRSARRLGVLLVSSSVLAAGLAALSVSAAGASFVISVPRDKPTIQAAIDFVSEATSGTIFVSPGTYHENIDFKGKTIALRSLAGHANTIIDGGGTSPVVVFKSAESQYSMLHGFTITRGMIPSQGAPGVTAGAGISIAGASPKIMGNIITGNHSGGLAGAGIGVVGGNPLISDNVITGNHTGVGGVGGGIYASAGAVILSNQIKDNSADTGGGIVLYGGPSHVGANVISGNRASSHKGGGVALVGSGGLLVNNLITDNIAASLGGGVNVTAADTVPLPYLLNNTIVGNEAPQGSAVAVETGPANLVGNIVVGPSGASAVACRADAPSRVTFSYNDITTGGPSSSAFAGCADPTGTARNISVDPRFVSTGATPDYHLQPSSPCVDAGNLGAVSLPTVDRDMMPRFTDGDGDGLAVIDMGSHEAPDVAPTGERYLPVVPARILDTRTGAGAPAAQLGPESSLDLQVTGQGGVPTTGVSAVVLNVTVTEVTATSFLTVWPTGLTRPVASNVNYTAGQTVPNLVVAKVGANGRVSFYNNAGSADVVVDVAGWYAFNSRSTDPWYWAGARYTSVNPARILDTRAGLGAKLGPTSSLQLQVTGRGGVPATSVSAVILNVTVTDPTATSFLTAWPSGVARPLASNLNYSAGQTVPNLVMVKVGGDGRVSLYNHSGSVHVVVDVAGWFGGQGAPGGTGYNGVTPARILDTRSGLGAPAAKLGPASSLDLQVAGRGAIPATGVSAVILNVTVTEPTATSFLTAWPSGTARPLASNLNYSAGETVPNLVVVKVGSGGRVSLYNYAGSAHVVVDVAGWYA
jgi:parallel beta-helix repeat protein